MPKTIELEEREISELLIVLESAIERQAQALSDGSCPPRASFVDPSPWQEGRERMEQRHRDALALREKLERAIRG